MLQKENKIELKNWILPEKVIPTFLTHTLVTSLETSLSPLE